MDPVQGSTGNRYSGERELAHQWSGSAAGSEQDSVGFFRALFDTRFREFITPAIVRVAYILVIVVDVIFALGILFVRGESGPSPWIRLMIAGVFFFLFLIGYRLIFELFMVLYRIERNTREIARNR